MRTCAGSWEAGTLLLLLAGFGFWLAAHPRGTGNDSIADAASLATDAASTPANPLEQWVSDPRAAAFPTPSTASAALHKAFAASGVEAEAGEIADVIERSLGLRTVEDASARAISGLRAACESDVVAVVHEALAFAESVVDAAARRDFASSSVLTSPPRATEAFDAARLRTALNDIVGGKTPAHDVVAALRRAAGPRAASRALHAASQYIYARAAAALSPVAQLNAFRRPRRKRGQPLPRPGSAPLEEGSRARFHPPSRRKGD
jgi:hypothetical protein